MFLWGTMPRNSLRQFKKKKKKDTRIHRGLHLEYCFLSRSYKQDHLKSIYLETYIIFSKKSVPLKKHTFSWTFTQVFFLTFKKREKAAMELKWYTSMETWGGGGRQGIYFLFFHNQHHEWSCSLPVLEIDKYYRIIPNWTDGSSLVSQLTSANMKMNWWVSPVEGRETLSQNVS